VAWSACDDILFRDLEFFFGETSIENNYVDSETLLKRSRSSLTSLIRRIASCILLLTICWGWLKWMKIKRLSLCSKSQS